jgi:predicted nucleic acid-binding Zn ribbon protein
MICPICNNPFESKTGAKTCSDNCRDIRWKKLNYPKVKRRRSILKIAAVEYKGGKCICCGYSKCKEALDFHHLDPSHKDFNISHSLNISWHTIKNELEKCVLVCANCHREIHAGIVNINDFDHPSSVSSIEDPRVFVSAKPKYCSCGTSIFRQSWRCEKCARASLTKLKIDKNVLAKLLWEQPTSQIAETYSVSDTAVAKLAKKFGLPKPPRGYWSKQK